VAIPDGDARKLAVVLRLGEGDALTVVDSAARSYSATLARRADGWAARLDADETIPLPCELEIVLAQGVPKGAKMDFVVEKATELGIARIVPFTSAHSVTADARAGKVERWRRLAETAARQCGRVDVPGVTEPCPFAAMLAMIGGCDRAIVAWEATEPAALRERLPELLAGVRSVAIVVGPEGGLSHAEADLATAAGATLVSLGRRILRTETAGLVTIAALRYAAGDL